MPTSFGNNGTAIGTMQGPGPGPSIVDLVQLMNSQLNTRLSGIEQNLSKLTAIKNNIAGVQMEISNIKSDNVVLRTKRREVRQVLSIGVRVHGRLQPQTYVDKYKHKEN